MNKLIILTECIDEGVMNMWHFPPEEVTDKYQMAQYIIANLDRYDGTDMFSWSNLWHWRRYDERTPESLLQAIHDSHVDGDSEAGFDIHELDLSNPFQSAKTVKWSSESEMAQLAALHGTD